jgi:hypothetical protein
VRSGEQRRDGQPCVVGSLTPTGPATGTYAAPSPQAARAKLASSCPAGIDHLSMSLILCGFGLPWSRRRSTPGE